MARIRSNGNAAKKRQPPGRSAAKPKFEQAAGENPVTAAPPEKEVDPGVAGVPPIFKTLADTTSHVVRQAASILEEEVAAGILTARQIQNKFIDTSDLRSAKPDEVFQRFRRDAHDVVDILMDIVGATMRNAGRMAQRAISIRSGARPSGDAGAISVLTLPQPVKAGETGEVALVVENDGDATAEPFELRCTDLLSAAGDRIPTHDILIEPSVIKIEAHQSQRVVVCVKPAAGTPSGAYSGLIQSSRTDQLRAVLAVVVA
jgi:hypothetical protein